jgi:hypothetical protein
MRRNAVDVTSTAWPLLTPTPYTLLSPAPWHLPLQLPPDDMGGTELKQRLGVELVPCIQFIRHGRVVWQEQGFLGMEQDMAEGEACL